MDQSYRAASLAVAAICSVAAPGDEPPPVAAFAALPTEHTSGRDPASAKHDEPALES